MRIKEIQESERPRERLVKVGVDKLSNIELLEVILSSGNRNKSVIELANEILSYLKSFTKLSSVTYQELLQIKGIKQAKASIILCAIELGKRIVAGEIENKILFENTDELYRYYYPKYIDISYEKMYVLYVDIKGKLIKEEEVSNLNSISLQIDPKQICMNAIKMSCYGVIIIHNHPSGSAKPSKNDIKTTYDLKKALEIINVFLIEHIVIGRKQYYLILKNSLMVD